MAKLGIKPKILLLVAPILVFEISFYAVLHQMMENLDDVIDEEKHAREIKEVSTTIGRTLATGHSELEVYLATKDQAILNKLTSRNNTIEEQIKTLRTLTQRDYALSNAVDDLAAITRKIITMQNVFLQQTADVHSLQFALLIRQQVTLARENEMVQNALNSIMKERLRLLEEKERKARSQTNLTILLGLLSNIGVVIVGGLVFGKNIAGRLEDLADNASRFASNLPLKVRHGGNDEIAQLESTFFEMAQAISTAREKEQAIINGLNIGLVTIDDKHKIESLNPTAQALFGYTEDAIAGHRLGKLLVSKVDEDKIAASLAALTETAGGDTRVKGAAEVRAQAKDRTFAAECSVTLLAVQPPRYLLSILDVTEKHQAEQLRQDLIAMLSHDLRAPLANIKAALELIQHKETAKESSSPHLDQIDGTRNEIDRMMRLINDLLDISKMESGKFPLERKVIPLWAPIQRSVKTVAGFAEQKNVKIETEDTEIESLADPDRLEQVFVNLLTNAIKATGSGGTIRIKFSTIEKQVLITVSDSGHGISADDLPYIFDKFYRPDTERQEGSGLGLAICKTIIEQHGGTITVDSKQGEGTVFYITLDASPVSQADD